MQHSIKRFLFTYITIAVLVTYALLSLASYLVSQEELNELYDATLEQVASAIVAQHLAIDDSSHLYNNNKTGLDTNIGDFKIDSEEEFYVRILANDDTVLYVSHPGVNVPLTSSLGLSTQQHQDTQWRIFSTKANQETIQVAQPIKFRKMTIKETAFSLMGSQLLFIPVLVILIFIAIKKALSPLATLSSDIQKRHSHDLKPFSEDEMPVEMKPLVHSLNTFMHRVSDMVSVLKRFTADAAHELRTPITALRIQLNLIEQAKSASEREQAINTLKGGIERSEQLISQLLTLARTEPNSQSREVKSINLLSLIKECIEGLLPQAYEKFIDLGLQPSEELKVIGVRHEIKVLINNIMENAIRYTPNHGKIDISLFSNAEDIVLEIKDNGPGIPNDDFERVFERFYRGENLNVNGSGLGLSIVREIATQHDARIELLNLNPGFSFRVYFIR